MINLNNIELEYRLSDEMILRKVSDYQIFAYYIPELELNTAMCSPLREDGVPSFSVFYASNIGKLLFTDFATKEKGDCFVFVSKLFNIDYYQALQRIAYDFGITAVGISADQKKRTLPKNIDYKQAREVHLGIKYQDFTTRDIKFWKDFGITTKTLNKYNVYSCTHIFINDKILVVNNLVSPAYAYLESKDGKYTYKIYQPFNKEHRFISNVDKSVWQGWTQMPDRGDKLIITKSLKDVMAITELMGIPAVAMQAETTDPKPHIIDQLKSRFDKVYLLYDNDFNKETNWGRKYGAEIAQRFNLTQIEIADLYKSKDFSDLVKDHGKEEAIVHLNNLINNN